MAYYLCIDVGNSKTKIGVFRSGQQVFFDQVDAVTISILKNILNRYEITHCIISQVKSIKTHIKKYLRRHCSLSEYSLDNKLPVKIKYKTPHTLGKDRLAAVIGASRLYPNVDLLVIGIGTCVTYDVLTANRYYLGGSISPGLEMRLAAMHRFTARLPLVHVDFKQRLLGNSTENALQSGALWGLKSEMQGMIENYKKGYPGLKVVLTGGGGLYFRNRLKKPIFAHPNLVLLGLNEILSLNVFTN